MKQKSKQGPEAKTSLRQRAESNLRRNPIPESSQVEGSDAKRQLHELQVHQIELEMQNAELQESRDTMEIQMQRYSDLYDFAPVGYFSVDEKGAILEANLTAATQLGVNRAALLNCPLASFLSASYRTDFAAFLRNLFEGGSVQWVDVSLARKDRAIAWARMRGSLGTSENGKIRICRLSMSDVTASKLAEDAQQRADTLAATNQKLALEISQRLQAEKSLRREEKHQQRLLKASQQMQMQLRQFSHQILQAQEDERKRVSRELHDVIAQALVGITVQLATLTVDKSVNLNRPLKQKILKTQKVVEESVEIIQCFARDLRPAALDALGLIPALEMYVRGYIQQTGIAVNFTAFAGVEQLDSDSRTVLYRVTQESLTNVARHANASRVEVGLRRSQGKVHLNIHDNGRGFRVQNRRGTHLGLIGMRERVEMIGGVLRVDTAVGEGTTIHVELKESKLCSP